MAETSGAAGGVRFRIREALLNYLSEAALILLALLVYRTNAYYVGMLSVQSQESLVFLGVAYLAGGLPWHFLRGWREVSKSRLLLRALRRYIPEVLTYFRVLGRGENAPCPALEAGMKTAALFMLVKLFFLPLMLNFTFQHIRALLQLAGEMTRVAPGGQAGQSVTYRLVTELFYFIDTLFFTFGYLVESRLLRNEVRSVEPTWLGWTVALMCYPPFNGVVDRYIPWQKDDLIGLGNPHAVLVCRILVLLFTFIYLWATLALGAKCSNLTNRGIVSRGPYRFVRHPAYIAKNIAWWIMTLPLLGWATVLSGIVWGAIYFMRAITEEQHLMADPDYREYCRKVRWRFIPLVY